MTAQPLFSVVIPTFNRSRTIQRAVDSVLGQTEQDFEIIIVDDGSTDETFRVVNVLSAAEPRIKYFKQANGGASRARNRGIEESNGKFVAFLDSDDIFLPFHLRQARDILCNDSEKIICTYAPIIVDRGNGVTLTKPHRAIRATENVSEYLMADRGFIPTITLVVPKILALQVKYDEFLGKGDDYDFAIRLAASGANFVMLNSASAVWFDHYDPARLSNSNNLSERIEWLDRIKHIITEKAYLSEMGWPIAKYLSEDGKKLTAFKYYFKAFFKGCFRPKMALVIFLQISLSKNSYRKLSDILAKLGIKP